MSKSRIVPHQDASASLEPDRKRQLIIGTSSVALANVLAACGTLEGRILNFDVIRVVSSAIALGPLLGWWGAYSRNQLEGALPLLLPDTALCIVPFALWIRSCQSWMLAVAAFFWFLSGHYFAIGMWI